MNHKLKITIFGMKTSLYYGVTHIVYTEEENLSLWVKHLKEQKLHYNVECYGGVVLDDEGKRKHNSEPIWGLGSTICDPDHIVKGTPDNYTTKKIPFEINYRADPNHIYHCLNCEIELDEDNRDREPEEGDPIFCMSCSEELTKQIMEE